MKWWAYASVALLILATGIAFLLTMSEPAEDIGEIKFGFVHGVETTDGYTLVFDEARWLAGEDAENAAISEGFCTEETRNECLPNNFYILNESDTKERLPVADDAVVAMMTLNMETENVHETQITVERFSELINDETAHWTKVPYQILVNDGRVTIIEEVYIP